MIALYSIIIPVYNRPDEIDDLLDSLTRQTRRNFEVIVVDDGSATPCEPIVRAYEGRLRVRYFYIQNSGPGQARNYGARHAEGDVVIVLDSDCVVPERYLEAVEKGFAGRPTDAFGGADRADASFTPVQKAINYSMTSFFTTGGIRGSRRKLDKFYPRSYNMGMRRAVYEALGGFADMRYGEDIDFSIRIFKGGYACRYFPDAWVYHKRRATFAQFFRQVWHSGYARITLYRKYPDSLKWVHCLPAAFVVGVALILLLAPLAPALLGLLPLYAALVFLDSWARNRDARVAALSVVAAFTQLSGYGIGFLEALYQRVRKKKEI